MSNKIKLSNGFEIPPIGIGTYPLNNYELFKTIKFATSSGFQLLDSASAYGNSRALGLSVKLLGGGVSRLIITSKFHTLNLNELDHVENQLDKVLKQLGLKQLDIFLMHWPYPQNIVKVWHQMENIYKSGKVKAIGVCNFEIRHLQELKNNCTILPMINQTEIHPLNTNKDVVKYCLENNIIVQAYCPFALMDSKITNNSILQTISASHNKSIAQTILRWNIQQNIIPIPKSSNKKRIKENFNVFDFDLTNDEMLLIDSLNENYRVYPPEKYCPNYI